MHASTLPPNLLEQQDLIIFSWFNLIHSRFEPRFGLVGCENAFSVLILGADRIQTHNLWAAVLQQLPSTL